MIFVIEDTSFIVPILNPADDFHKDAWKTMELLQSFLHTIKVIIPSIMILETAAVLLKNGFSPSIIEKKLWKLIHRNEVIVVDIPGNLSIKIINFPKSIISHLKTYDLILTLLGIEYNALILTFDKKIKNKTKNIYPYVYYCSSKGNMQNDIEILRKEMEERVNRFKT